ncbi:MAG: polysaccharide deacetylase family protein, partial [Selenomonadaceae bacterium]|nr:polysaccharide deacetylase family protein [Selenomonadaceae bacterium]
MTLSELHKFCRGCKRLFCYGAGRYGRTLLVHLQENGMDIASFLITGEAKGNSVLGKSVRCIQDIGFEKEDGVLLAVSERFLESMKRELELRGVTNYVSIDEVLLNEIEERTEFFSYQNNSPFVNVLMYHRVADNIKDPYGIAVSPKNFRKHMAYLKQNFHVLQFDKDWSDIKEASIVVTFDDGYADNFYNALPILEEYEIPATFFVSTENLDTDNLFWWDKLSLLFSACKNESVKLGNREFAHNDLKS